MKTNQWFRRTVLTLALLAMSSIPRIALGQTSIPRTLSNSQITQLQLTVTSSINRARIVAGDWTAGDWDSPHTADTFVRGLDQLNGRLEGLGDLLEQYQDNPSASIFAKIHAWLKISADQIERLEGLTQQHLVTPQALEGVLSDLEELENSLKESLQLFSDR